MTLIFATNNAHKVAEIKAAVGKGFNIFSLKEAGIDIDIPEPHDTLEANATEKSVTIYRLTNQNCFSEDTGLEVEALNGEPGVRSARYAGKGKSNEDNMHLLLQKMKEKTNRSAKFRTVISLIINGNEHLFEGICEGELLAKKQGAQGFGYDPIFVPHGAAVSFAEMTLEEKNRYSHRKKAVEQLIAFLATKTL